MMLRIAFIGAGQMARHHLRAIGRTGTPATVVGVHDRLASRAADLAGLAGAPTFASPDALLAGARPDIVHVCTPPDAHFDAARAALEGGAHVYVEKPFARTVGEARALLELSAARGLQVGAGHQLLWDPAFERMAARLPRLGTPVAVDSHFAFRPAGLPVGRSTPARLARELIDILPHPLYALVAVLERVSAPDTPVTLEWAHADATDVHALLRAGTVVGRLSVTLRGRPIASTLTVTGTGGALTCDFMRSMVTGAANPGTEVLEKVLNPVIEGAQMAGGTIASVLARVRSGISYPGLAESIGAFHAAVAAGRPSPLAPAHLLQVTDIFESLTARIGEAADAASARLRRPRPAPDAPLTVVTGARGLLGAAIARKLPRVRGIGRSAWPDDAPVHEWTTADLSVGVHPEALAGADVVVHAAAETNGGFPEHERNSIAATRHLLAAMHEAGVSRLVLVSSVSVIRPPRTPWERQDELTPRARDARSLGPYTWGKTAQEELVLREADALGIAARIIRPGALVDVREPAFPGLMGRRLLGDWHLGLGRPGLPIAACDVERCADAIAWCVAHFDEAPGIVNLLDPAMATRRDLLATFRRHGWSGRVCWVPIGAIALALVGARSLIALGQGRLPERQAAWSILRPRRYDSRLAAALLHAVARPDALSPVRDGSPVESAV